MCPKCGIDTPLAVMKPDIVFFGESLPGEFHRQMAADKNECDMLIVIGSSLKVRPVALIPSECLNSGYTFFFSNFLSHFYFIAIFKHLCELYLNLLNRIL